MNDHSGWPLWDEEGGTGPDDWPMLSAPLKQRLQAWSDHWSRHYARQKRWDLGTREAHRREGVQLLALVAAELGPAFTVTLTTD